MASPFDGDSDLLPRSSSSPSPPPSSFAVLPGGVSGAGGVGFWPPPPILPPPPPIPPPESKNPGGNVAGSIPAASKAARALAAFSLARLLGPAGRSCSSLTAWMRVRKRSSSLFGSRNSGRHDGGQTMLHTPNFSASGRILLMYASGSPAHSSSVGWYTGTDGTS